MRRTNIVLLIALLVAACGSDPGASPRTQGPQSSPPSTAKTADTSAIPAADLRKMRAALDSWATFPVDASVRPLVLTSDPVAAPQLGFKTGDAKEAFLTGLFTAPSALPVGPPDADGYAVVSASDALATMRAEGTPAIGAPRPPAPLVITDVRFGESSFETDRGTRSLPAWLFSFEGVENPAAVLAVAPSSRFAVPARPLGPASVGAQLAPDGRTVTIRFVGAAAGRGPCTAEYAVDQLASRTAVVVNVRETRHEVGTCTTPGYARQQTVVFDAPLGNRELVDAATNAPVQVAP